MSTVALLRVEHLVKRFGGLAATDDASLSVEDGEIHALIGPNGAGKTTLIHQLSGALEPTSGTIWFGGQNITGLPMHTRVHLGLVRSYQITSVFKRLSVLDNLALAVQAKSGSSLRFWQPARSEKWDWRWPCDPNCCCSTNPWPAWGRTNPSVWWRCCKACAAKPPCCW